MESNPVASLTHDQKRKRARIQFVGPDQCRRCLTISQKKNETEKGFLKRGHSLLQKLEDLIENRASGEALDNRLSKWLDLLKPSHRKTLEAAGLVDPKAESTIVPEDQVYLLAFARRWMEDRLAEKKSTRAVWNRAVKQLASYFPETAVMSQITEYDAERYSRHLRQTQELAESTSRKMIGVAKQILQSAVKARLVAQNPFSEEKTTPPEKAEEKQHHVSDEEIRQIYQACP